MDVMSAKSEHTSDVAMFFANLSVRQALSTACECIEKVLPKENKFYWQALVLRTASAEGQATSQVLNGEELQLLLDSTLEGDSDSNNDRIQ